jgi:hypothetical protein
VKTGKNLKGFSEIKFELNYFKKQF